MKSLYDLGEYPVETFHSTLQAETSEADNGELLRRIAKALDTSKVITSNFYQCSATEWK